MKIERSFTPDGDRYIFDFDLCPSKEGWAQLDTRQDAWYYGNWANPFERKIISYAEGDVTITTCDTDEEFVAEMNNWVRWNKENDYFIGIDPGFNEELKAKFQALGLSELMH